jgi:hypothetical protein
MIKNPIYNNTNDNKPSDLDIFLRGLSTGFSTACILIFALYQLFG